jgi:hypothetical protein
VLAHVYGGLYSAALLLALVAWDLARARPTRRGASTCAAGWRTRPAGLALVPWLGVYQAQRASAHRSWMTPPSLGAIVRAYRFELSTEVVPFALLAAGLLAATDAALRTRRRPAGPPAAAADTRTARLALLAVACGLLAVPLMAAAVSHVVVPIFHARYFIAAAFAGAIVSAYVLTAVLEGDGAAVRLTPPLRRLARLGTGAGWGAVCLVLLAWPVAYQARAYVATPRPGAELERLRVDGAPATALPVVVESAFDYLPIIAYAPAPGAYTFVLDSAVALAPDSHNRELLGHTLLRVYRRVGYTRGRIVDVDRFVCAHDRFVVLDSREADWFDLRVARDPAFTRELVGRTTPTSTTPGAVIRVVRRVPGRTPTSCGPAYPAGAAREPGEGGVGVRLARRGRPGGRPLTRRRRRRTAGAVSPPRPRS